MKRICRQRLRLRGKPGIDLLRSEIHETAVSQGWDHVCPGQNRAVGHGVLIAASQTMFKPGLDGLSHGVSPVFGGKAVTLVSTQSEQLLLRLCLGLSGHPLPLPLACGAESDIDGRHPPLPRFVPVKRALAAATACGHSYEPSLLSREDRCTPSWMKLEPSGGVPELRSVGGLTESAHR